MSKLRQGVVKRGTTWSYVVRVANPETGRTRPKWVGGFASEEEAKAARDEARVAARRGEYVNRSTLTVREYLTEWVDAHAASVKVTLPYHHGQEYSPGLTARILREAGLKQTKETDHE